MRAAALRQPALAQVGQRRADDAHHVDAANACGSADPRWRGSRVDQVRRDVGERHVEAPLVEDGERRSVGRVVEHGGLGHLAHAAHVGDARQVRSGARARPTASRRGRRPAPRGRPAPGPKPVRRKRARQRPEPGGQGDGPADGRAGRRVSRGFVSARRGARTLPLTRLLREWPKHRNALATPLEALVRRQATSVSEEIGGVDGTRTRGLCRDRAAF